MEKESSPGYSRGDGDGFWDAHGRPARAAKMAYARGLLAQPVILAQSCNRTAKVESRFGFFTLKRKFTLSFSSQSYFFNSQVFVGPKGTRGPDNVDPDQGTWLHCPTAQVYPIDSRHPDVNRDATRNVWPWSQFGWIGAILASCPNGSIRAWIASPVHYSTAVKSGLQIVLEGQWASFWTDWMNTLGLGWVWLLPRLSGQWRAWMKWTTEWHLCRTRSCHRVYWVVPG